MVFTYIWPLSNLLNCGIKESINALLREEAVAHIAHQLVSHGRGCSVGRWGFHMLSWLLLSLEKQKGWKEMVIPLHLRISNKNLLQPPACLQDFLFCLTTSIFKLAKLPCQELPQLPSPLRSHPGYVSSYAVLLVLFYDFWWGVPPVPWLCGSDWHEEVKGETCHLPACL